MSNKTKSSWDIIAFLTLGTLISYIIFSYFQIRQTNESLRLANAAMDSTQKSGIISDSLNRKAIEIADSAMNISKNVAEMQREFTKKELRAYVGIDIITDAIFKINEPMQFKIRYINWGKTPAFNLSACCISAPDNKHISQIDFDTIKNTEFSKVGSLMGTNHTLIQEYTGKKATIYETNLIIEAINNKNITANFRGIIIYYDIFRDRHYTQFYIWYDPDKKQIYLNDTYNKTDYQNF